MNSDIIMTNPQLVLREEFDDWALLFDPDTGETYGLNPVGVFVWKHMDGKHTVSQIVDAILLECQNVPPNVDQLILPFIEDLVNKGFAGSQFKGESTPK
jgi:SynChlorMet cassette protein ScmD